MGRGFAQTLIRIPKNPFCEACRWATAFRRQQRKKKAKGFRFLRPFSNPVRFGDLFHMDPWFAANDLSQGLFGETACVTFRDRSTVFMAARAVFEKSAEHVVNFLVNLCRPEEKLTSSSQTERQISSGQPKTSA